MSIQLKAKPQAKTIIVEEEPGFDLAIIGGGPAGLTAAIYALRSRLKTVLFEKMILGGQASTTYKIDNYPGFETISGMDLTMKMSEQAQKLGLHTIFAQVNELRSKGGGFEIRADGKQLTAKAVILASGCEAAKMGIPGEDKFRGMGVSYCATCDGPFYQNKNVLVVGGGNSAVEEALYLTRFASKVSIVHRRDILRADRILAEQAKAHPKIYFFWHSVPEEIIGDKTVTEVVLKDLASGKKLRVPAEGVFVYIGSRPNSELVKHLVKLDENSYLLTDDRMKTSVPGLFAAGDIRSKSLRQVVTAASDGAIAAETARQYIEKIV